jgi:hypothetical protein
LAPQRLHRLVAVAAAAPDLIAKLIGRSAAAKTLVSRSELVFSSSEAIFANFAQNTEDTRVLWDSRIGLGACVGMETSWFIGGPIRS